MTSNPMFNSRVTENVLTDEKPMSIQGSINKTIVLTLIVALSGAYTWNLCLGGFSDKADLLAIFGAVVGLVLAIITSFRPQNAKILAPVYAVCEGLVVGSISYTFNSFYQGIVVNAVSITILALLTMLFLYKTKVIQATEKFRQVILISTIAVAIFYLAGFIGALFGHPMTIFNGSMVGIVVSFVICGIAAFNFILDFDFIERGATNGLPSYFEWYGAFGLLVTLIWLYIEVLRLLAQLQDRK